MKPRLDPKDLGKALSKAIPIRDDTPVDMVKLLEKLS